MKMVFRGWKREVKEHEIDVIPVTLTNRKYTPGGKDAPLTWETALVAHGKVEDLGLSGAFLVNFHFDKEELGNWLKKYVRANPEAAIRLLGEMQAEAILALSRKTEDTMQAIVDSRSEKDEDLFE